VTNADNPRIAFLHDIDLIVPDGKIVGLVGESGAGKSLLLAAILGVLRRPAHVISGNAYVDDLNLLALPERELNRLRGRQIGFIGPNPHVLLNPLLPVGVQVANFLRAHAGRADAGETRDRVVEMFRSVGIQDPDSRFESYPHELSGGMAQRVIISIGLISSPALILADEPTFGLDVTIQAQVLELIRKLIADAGRSMLLVTRDLAIVAQYCDLVYILNEGRMLEGRDVVSFFDAPGTDYGQSLLDSVSLAGVSSVRGQTP